MEFNRHNNLCEQIVFIDGMSGTGKSILSPILASFERVEKFRIDYNIEYPSIMSRFGNMSIDDAAMLVRLSADVNLFNTMISREVNFRPSDDSGVFRNPKSALYLKRLFIPGNDDIIKQIAAEKPILHIMSHNLLQVSQPVFKAFGKGLLLVVMVRHPAYMIEHWYNYIERFGTDPREFSLAIGKEGNIPWFAGEIENYTVLSTMDKVIHGCKALLDMQKEILQALSPEQRKQVMLIPFESFVIDPLPWIGELTNALSSKATGLTSSILKKQKCPREYINAGKGHKHYGFSKQTAQLSEKDDYGRRMKFIKEKASPGTLRILEELSTNYVNEYKFPRKMPWQI